MRFGDMHRIEVVTLFSFNRFESLRASKGITKKYIADALDRTPTLIQDWKSGKSAPNKEQLQIVADILGTTPEYLSGETDEKNPPTSRSGNPWAERLRSLSPADLSLFVRILESLENNPTGTRAALDLALTAAQSVRQVP